MPLDTRHINLRVSDPVHKDLTFISQVEELSLNEMLVDALEYFIRIKFADSGFHERIDKWVAKTKKATDEAAERVKSA